MSSKPKGKEAMYISRRMHRSLAFCKLTSRSIIVLLEFYSRRLMEGNPSKGFQIRNNGEIVLTYDEAGNRFGMARSTFRRAIDQLVELGFLYIAHQGGGMMKDYSKYGISERWREYGREEFIKKSRQKDTRKLGFTKDNWEKRTGRKRKPKSKTSIGNNTCSSITNDTHGHQMPVTPSIVHATLKTDPNYYIQKGLEVLEAMHPAQYH